MNVRVVTPAKVLDFTDIDVPVIEEGGALSIRRSNEADRSWPVPIYKTLAAFGPMGWLRWERTDATS